jgi:solute carrier family 25 protein 39/40
MAMGIPSSAIYMVGYDHLRMALLPAAPTDSQLAFTPLFAGSLARTISATVISPLELFRTRLQAVPSPGERSPSVRSTLAHLRTEVAAKGARTLWTGLGATLWRDVPFSGIYWAGYEVIKGRLLVGPRWEKSAASEFGAGGMGESEWARPVVAGAGSGMVRSSLRPRPPYIS